MSKKIELAGVWRDWRTDPPRYHHGNWLGEVTIKWAGKSGETCFGVSKWYKKPVHLNDVQWLDSTPEALQSLNHYFQQELKK